MPSLGAVALVTLVLGNTSQAAATTADSALVEEGRAIWNFHCYFCHGYAGDAQTLAASYLTPKPRNFRETSPETLPHDRMVEAVRDGRPETAMRPFADRLTGREIEAVVAFVRDEFMIGDRDNTRYHTKANGWSDHARYQVAYPFATGEIALDTPWNELSREQVKGKQLFLSSCVTCHDRSRVEDPGPIWTTRPLSYPRAGYTHRPDPDAITAASPYALHDIPKPLPENADALTALGATTFQDNCAFCHAADGTAKNWIGRFLEPHPRDLTDPVTMAAMTPSRLRAVIRDGLPGSSMPAWKGVLEDREIDALVHYIDRVMHPLAHQPSEDSKKR